MKLLVLNKLSKLVSLNQNLILMKACFESEFGYSTDIRCFIWMVQRKISHLRQRSLGLVLNLFTPNAPFLEKGSIGNKRVKDCYNFFEDLDKRIPSIFSKETFSCKLWIVESQAKIFNLLLCNEIKTSLF